MIDLVNVVYIGDKPVKRDTVTGSRMIFPRFEPVPVEKAIALQLLEFPTVFRRGDDLDKIKAEFEAQQAAEQAAALAAAEEEAKRQADQSMVVGEFDLGKMNSAQLRTLVEAQDLELKQESDEKVGDFRIRVRDALRAKQDNA